MTSGSEKPRLKPLERASKRRRPVLHLTQRDLEIIRAVYEYRALTTPQVEALLFPGGTKGKTNTCRLRLKKLFHNGYLWRSEMPAIGKAPLVYRIDREALPLLSVILDIEPEEIDWHPRERVIPNQHLLKTNDVRIAINLAAAAHGLVIEQWLDDRTLKRTHAKDQVTIVGPKGGKKQVTVIPDGYFRLWYPDKEKRAHFFLEVDLATEVGQASQWGRRDFATKMRKYTTYFYSGLFQRRYKAKTARVLTVTTSDRRVQTLKTITEDVGGKRRFWFSTFDLISPRNVLTKKVWQVASMADPQALV